MSSSPLVVAASKPLVSSITSARTAVLQRQCDCGQHTGGGECEECKKRKTELQRHASAAQAPAVAPPIVNEVLNSPGEPLHRATRDFMEPRFGHDFSKVRVHTDAKAADSARAVNALAYTVGRDIVFGPGRYAPDTTLGRQLLSHELTHTIQQSDGLTGGAQLPSSLQISDRGNSCEREAEAQAARIAREQTSGPVPREFTGAQLQRQADIKQAPKGLPCILDAGSGHTPGLDVFFNLNSSAVTASQKATVADFVKKWVADGSKDDVIVDGWASMDGPQSLNWRLSCERAETVKAELKARGVPERKIKTWAHGESTEFSTGDLTKNRRAIINRVSAAVPTPPTPTTPAPKSQEQTPTPPSPSINDCDASQTTMLTGHLASARTWVNDAAQKIANYAYIFASTRHEGAPRDPAAAKVVRSALQDNFHTIEPGYVRVIAENFAELRAELNKSFTFECEDEGCGDLAYVRGAFAFIRRHANIHVCPPWFRCQNYSDRVVTLIHERAHQHPGARGDTYEDEAGYAKLSPDDAVENADSYAVAVRQIYHGGAHGPGPRSC